MVIICKGKELLIRFYLLKRLYGNKTIKEIEELQLAKILSGNE